MKRWKVAAGVVGLSAVSAVAGFAVGPRISSPGNVALRAKPPVPAPILVPVERRILSAHVVTRGTGRFGLPQKLAVITSSLRTGPALVSEVPTAGTLLSEGDVAVTAAGRPLFVLVGAQPMSRDLGPGMTGDDIRQLEAALGRLGFSPGKDDGLFDSQTASAVTRWYRSKGFTPTTTTTEQMAAIRERESALDAARIDSIIATDSLESARSSLVTAQAAWRVAVQRARDLEAATQRVRTETAAVLAAAERDVVSRRAVLDAVHSPGERRSATPSQIAAAEAELAAARSNQAATRAAGARALGEADRARDDAPVRLAAAERAAVAASAAALSDIAAKQAALVSAGFPSAPTEGQVIDVAALNAKITAAESELATARANAEAQRGANEQAVADARAARDMAPGLADNTRVQVAAADEAAEHDVAAKQATLDALISPPVSSGPLPTEVATAERELDAAVGALDIVRAQTERLRAEAAASVAEAISEIAVKRAAVAHAEHAVTNAARARLLRSTMTAAAATAVADARGRAGVHVPADEVVFVPEAPVRVANLLVGPGDAKSGALMLVTDARVRVDGGLAVKDASLVRPGMTVNVTEPDLGISAVGSVTTVAEGPGTNGVDGFHVYFEVDVHEPPAALVGASVRLTIPVTSTGRRVLAVPVSALSLAPDGTSLVQRQRAALLESVAVRPGLTADGYVAVVPLDMAGRPPLQAGDLVTVGFDHRPGTS